MGFAIVSAANTFDLLPEADKLERLHDVIQQAARCRNHCTHGPIDRYLGDADYADFKVILFLTETLEFI